MVSRHVRRGSLILLCSGLLLVVLVLLAPRLLPAEKIRALIVSRVEQATGAQVSLGEAEVRLWPRLRVTVADGSIAGTGAQLAQATGSPNNLDRYRVDVGSLDIDLALRPLLHRRIETGTIRLHEPRAEVVTRPPADASRETAASDTGTGGDLSWGLAVAGLEVRDGHLEWRESGTTKQVVVAGWRQDVTLDDLDSFVRLLDRFSRGVVVPAGTAAVAGEAASGVLGEHAAAGLAATVDRLSLIGMGPGPDRVFADLALRGRLVVPAIADRLVVELEELRWADTALRGAGTCTLPAPGAAVPLRLELNGSLDLAALSDQIEPWRATAGVGAAPAQPHYEGTVTWNARARIESPPPTSDLPAWWRALAGGELPGIAVGASVAPLLITGDLPGAPWRIEAVELQSDLDTATIQARGLDHEIASGAATLHIDDLLREAEMTLDLDLALLDLDRLVTAFGRPVQTARGETRASWRRRCLDLLATTAWAEPAARRAPGDLIPTDLKLRFGGTATRLVLQRAPYDEVRIAGRLADRVVEVDSLQARRSTGRIDGRGTIDYRTDPFGALDFTAEAFAVPTSALLAPYLPALAPQWEGVMSARVRGGCRLENSQLAKQTLRLTGEASSSDGIFHAQQLLAEVRPYLGTRQDLQDIRFTALSHTFEVLEGRYLVRDLRADGPDTDWQGNGWVSFAGAIDLALSVKLPAGFTPELGQLVFLADGFREPDGRLKLDFRFTGEAAKPSVNLDLEQAKQRIQSQLEDDVNEGVRGLLDKLKGR